MSQHSSNPLELPSSDVRNRAALHRYRKARAMAGNQRDSDEPEDELEVSDLKSYQRHIAGLLQDRPAAHARYTKLRTTGSEVLIDLDEDMDGDKGQDNDEENSDEDDSSMDADADAEVDEEMTLYLKSREEREEIEREIADLEEAVPSITQDYKLIDRLGTGTFSSVYKALDLGYHEKWDNGVWHGLHPAASSAHYQSLPRQPGTKVFVAVKRIYVTSNPERIRNEISILETCRGARHVSQLITAFRQDDQVVAIMPYLPHEDFRLFYRTLPIAGIRTYFRCMFRALRDIHARGIIHRDVKPANFLFDPHRGVGTLVDLGLACRMGMDPPVHYGKCLHTGPTREHAHGRIRRAAEYNSDFVKRKQKDARMRSGWTSDRVGYLEKDTRPQSKANRAGTRGFRAPEVLLKCNEQTGAIDVWSAGMILLFFLSGKFPLFQSNDDVEALLELACIIGRRKMEITATLHSRTFTTNIPSITQEGKPWREFVETLNPKLREQPESALGPNPYSLNEASSGGGSYAPPPPSSSPGADTAIRETRLASPHVDDVQDHETGVEQALDLLERLLHPESIKRITPRQALYHPFLRESEGDDAFFPHPFGEGVCGEWHFVDPVTEEFRVRIRTEEGNTSVIAVMAGQGMAMGDEPCEFHRTEDFSTKVCRGVTRDRTLDECENEYPLCHVAMLPRLRLPPATHHQCLVQCLQSK
ncbi:kinase-like protein [Russula earlei]|uniref:Kinase-like protein n=1 Tax=Russula earlei TaxID=71964 RepID=A0ACC0U9W1_9AGAM|nr:kinase-like protein [Russula earlei]